MADLLVIFGVTGQQGASIVSHVLDDAQLSQRYRIRGVTRDPNKAAAQALAAKGIEIVQADLDDPASVKSAMHGAHTVFSMTVSIYAPGGQDQENAQGKAITDAAVAAGVQFYIYSTVPSTTKISQGRFPVGSWDCKDAMKTYIESLPIKSAFFAPGGFMQNFHTHMAPRPGPDGQLAVTNFMKSDTQFPLIDIAEDTGKFVGAMLADPQRYAGTTFCAASRVYTLTEIVQIMSRVSGRPVKYQQIPKAVFAGFLPDANRETMLNMFSYIETYGYFGPETEQLVHWAATNARGTPSTFEDFLQRNGLRL